MRKRLEALVATGLAVCARCGGPIDKGAPFDLDHADDRKGYLGVSHPSCNRGARGRRAQAVNGKPAADAVWAGLGSEQGRRWSRDWDALGDDEGRRVPRGW
jgi:hypothetical protein